MKSIFSSLFLFLFFFSLNAQNDKYQKLMEQDWPQLKRYQQKNAEIITNSNWPKVVFMGNSITEGWVQQHPDFFSSHNFAGRGISGQTTPQMLLRFTQDVLDLRPEVVVILAGTNDIAANTGYATTKMIQDNIKAMCILARSQNIKVVLSSILPVYDYPWRPGLNPVPRIAEINAWLKDYAASEGHIYLDYFSKLKDEREGLPEQYARDGVHPTSKAYSLMEPMALNAIQAALE